MIGKGVLMECLDDAEIAEVICINRSPMETKNSKITEIIHRDFSDFETLRDKLKILDACFFCLGVSAGGMKEEDYRRVTYDYTLAAASTLKKINPDLTFIYVSGQGTDATEKGRMMWARVKGKTENDLLSLGFRQCYMFRPGMIIPLRGIESRTPAYRFMYRYFTWLIRLYQLLSPSSVTDTTRIARAMINAHRNGFDRHIVKPPDINQLAMA